MWRLEKMEDAVLDALRRVDLPGGSRISTEAKSAITLLETRLAEALKRRERLLDLVEEGDDGAAARAKALSKTISELKGQIGEARHQADVARAIPTYPEQLRVLRDLRGRLRTATEDELTSLRSRLAQTLRTTMMRIDFGPRTVVARMRIDQVRHFVGISQGSFPNGAPVTIVDEVPRVHTEAEMDDMAIEAAEDRARADVELAEFLAGMAASGG